MWPLRFKLRADYNRSLRNFEYGCSCKVSMAPPNSRLGSPSASLHCASTEALLLLIHQSLRMAGTDSHALLQDALLGGRFRVDANAHEIEYRCALQPELHSVASAALTSHYICFIVPEIVMYKQVQAFANIIAKEQHDLQKEAQIGQWPDWCHRQRELCRWLSVHTSPILSKCTRIYGQTCAMCKQSCTGASLLSSCWPPRCGSHSWAWSAISASTAAVAGRAWCVCCCRHLGFLCSCEAAGQL